MSTHEHLQPRQKVIVGGIVLLAFLLRLVYLLEAQASPYFESPIMDPLYHLEWARAIAGGQTFQEGPFFRAPLYPWFLGTLLRFFGEGLLLPRVFQAGLGALTTLFTFLIARRAFEFRVGVLAALLVATNWVLIYFDGELLIPTLSIPINLGALWLTMRLAREPSARNAGAAGLTWGLAALARPNVLLFMPLLFGWLLWRARPRLRSGLLPALALTGGVLAMILPITFYNSIVGGDTVLISSQAGVNLWIGNNPASDGSTAIVPGTRPGWWEGFHDSIALAEQAEGRELAPSEVSSHYTGRALDFITGDPSAAAGHFLWKLRLFWMDWELGNNADVQFFAFHFSRLLRYLPPSLGLLGPLALLGLWMCRRRAGELFPLWAFTLVYMLSVVLFFVCSRYRAPVLPLYAVLSSFALFSLYDQVRARQWMPVGVSAVCLSALAVMMQQLPSKLDTTEAKGLWALGIHELAQDRPREAARYFQECLAVNPGYWIAHKDLGLAQQAAGDLIDAKQSYERALQIKPGDLQVSSLMVDLCIAREDLVTAEEVAARSLQVNSAFSLAYDSMSRVQIARKNWDAARAILGEGLKRSPADFMLNFRLGAIELQNDQPCRAVEAFGRAVASPQPPSQALLQAAHGAWKQAKSACRP